MKRHVVAAVALAAASLAMSAQARAEHFTATFSGFNEIGGLGAGETGAILSNGTATLRLDLNERAGTATYTLTFSGLSAPITQSHIHFGKRHVAGGVIVFLCASTGTPAPAGTPNCGGGTSGTVTGTLSAAQVIGPGGQGLAAGDFEGFTDAVESNTGYGNIHTTRFPAGEIRGEVRRFADEDENRDRDH